MSRYHWALVSIALQLAFVGFGAAQEMPKLQELPDAPVPKQESSEASKQQDAASTKQQTAPPKRDNPFQSTIEVLARRSVFFPDLATSQKPLRPRQKLELFADQSIAPSQIVSSLAGSAISQAADFLPGYGQGWNGYSKRFGSSMASGASNHFFGTFVISSLLHDDPRYFVKLHADLGHRVGYAVSRLVITRNDNGAETTNWPGILAPLFAESLANTYLPTNERTAGKTFRRYGIRLGLTAAANLAREYWPSIFRSLRITKTAPPRGSG